MGPGTVVPFISAAAKVSKQVVITKKSLTGNCLRFLPGLLALLAPADLSSVIRSMSMIVLSLCQSLSDQISQSVSIRSKPFPRSKLAEGPCLWPEWTSRQIEPGPPHTHTHPDSITKTLMGSRLLLPQLRAKHVLQMILDLLCVC